MKRSELFCMIMFLICSIVLSGCSREETVKNNVYLEDKNVSGMKRAEVQGLVENLAQEINIEPEDRNFNIDTREIEEEKPGTKVDVQKTVEAVLRANEGDKVHLVIEELELQYTKNINDKEVSPQYTENTNDKEDKVVEIGSATTPLLNKTESRVNNIRVALKHLDYRKIQPGEEFSFNGELGKRTKAKGYKKAPIIIRTEQGPKDGYGVGGGICQVSSTLYNAVNKSKLKVTERHGHSKDVGYVPKGSDATVVYGGADFKFVNTRSKPVMIRTFLNGDSVTIKIYESKD